MRRGQHVNRFLRAGRELHHRQVDNQRRNIRQLITRQLTFRLQVPNRRTSTRFRFTARRHLFSITTTTLSRLGTSIQMTPPMFNGRPDRRHVTTRRQRSGARFTPHRLTWVIRFTRRFITRTRRILHTLRRRTTNNNRTRLQTRAFGREHTRTLLGLHGLLTRYQLTSIRDLHNLDRATLIRRFSGTTRLFRFRHLVPF